MSKMCLPLVLVGSLLAILSGLCGILIIMLTSNLPLTLYRADQVRELDRLAIEQYDIPGLVLMQRAAESAYSLLKQLWPDAHALLVVCGAGNNGGDGYLLACLAHADGKQVTVLQAADKALLQGDAGRAWQQWRDGGGITEPGENIESCIQHADVIIDALMGTGLQRNISGEWAELVDRVNNADKPVLSIDIPSGIDADTGVVRGIAIQADATVTYIGVKRGLLTADGPDQAGQLYFDDLDVPEAVFEQQSSGQQILDEALLAKLLPARAQATHKGQCGHVLIIGGDAGMAGAVRMAGEACARVGAGLVTIATRPEHAAQITVSRPELMCHGIETADQLEPLLAKASVVAIGPGLGKSDWATELLAKVIETQLYLILDADALKLIAQATVKRGRWILTPHPGEAATLLDATTEQIQQDRFAAVKAIADRYHCVAVLKGCGSLVQTAYEETTYLCQQGNPGMATAGMGDVLTGVIAGFLAQGLSLNDAAHLGVLIHALAGDLAADKGQRGLLATDLFSCLRQLVNPDQSEWQT